jgi:uncharacterized protein (TIGR02600 family)
MEPQLTMNPKKPLVEPAPISHSQKGMALVIVLAVLVLLAGLVVAFFSTVTSDAGSSAVSSNDARAKQLADSAVNLVMGQIVEATKGGNSTNQLAWASQPGAIRTYTSAGAPSQIFKLYSSNKMVVPGITTSAEMNTLIADDSPAAWASQTALFTDLNAPVKDANNSDVYPIVDPTAQTGANAVKGFTITGAPTTGTTNSAPMPTRWLYMLKDGTLAAATATGNGTTVTVTGASASNPIVGRVAFWTDDETSKVNINTASGAPWNSANTTVNTSWGGSLTTTNPANYWDTPIIASPQDVNLAISQPWQGEFQRYPGHPATISLSAALPSLTTRDSIEALAPRLATGGSRGGGFVADSGSITTTQTAYKLIPDPDRLYASVDELLFLNPDRSTANATLTAQDLRRSGFFLTASSRAPEVTLFNTPRMVMWPINTQASKQTAYDKLIAFCGTVGPNKAIGSNNSYYFTRTDPNSATVDYNIPRNQQLLSYLRNLTTKAVPGFGGSSGILGKYNSFAPGESEQITTQIFDYIRCINTQDTSNQTTTTATPALYYAPNGMIMPTVGADNTRGFGRFPTVTKAGMIFWFNGNETTGNATTGVTLCARLLLESFVASHGHPSPASGMKYRVSGLSGLRWGENSMVTRPIFNTDPATNIGLGGNGRPHGGRWSVTSIANLALTNNGPSSQPPGGVPPPPPPPPPPTPPTPDTRTLYFSGGSVTIEVMGPGASTYVHQVININLPAATLPFPTDTTINPTIHFNGHAKWAGTWGNATTGRFSFLPYNFRPQDAVRSVGVTHGDFRLVAANPNVPSSAFSPVNDYGNSTIRVRHNFLQEFPYTMLGATFPAQNYYNTTDSTFINFPVDAINSFNPNTASNASRLDSSRTLPLDGFSAGFTWVNGDATQHGTSTYGPTMAAAVTGDFDNGYGAAGDGPYIGFADEGNARLFSFYYPSDPVQRFSIPYLDGSGAPQVLSQGFFSPNRLVPSAGIMGSLPTGVRSQTPWQTLLFRPAALTSASHRGLGFGNQAPTPTNQVADCLLLDLFNMPVVEPYAISEPLSTAGRVNMNYQILPFTYIKRSTAVQAALHTEWLTAIPNSQINAQNRKTGGTTSSINRNSRWPLNFSNNATELLKGFEDRFASGDIFRSPAEICSIPLVPVGANYSSMASWWTGYTLTGDNSKERPYTRIYPKLTTKSNSFTVHFRVQVLKKSPATPADQWVEGRDIVASEYRGSTLIERYIDPNNGDLPDFATNTGGNFTKYPDPLVRYNIDTYYRFRVIQTRRFAP